MIENPAAIRSPKFRTTGRLATWVRKNSVTVRLPSEVEEVFFKSKENSAAIASNLVKYSEWVGLLEERFEKLLLNDKSAIINYIANIRKRGAEVSQVLQDALIGDFKYLLQLARHLSNRRLAGHLEDSIFRTQDFTPERIVKYAEIVGPLDESLEELLIGNNDCIKGYMTCIGRHDTKLSVKLQDQLIGDDFKLFELARHLGRRLPTHLEDSLKSPGVCLRYARDILNGRLPSHLERVFMDDYHTAAKYAFEVIRGKASVRLPDELHTLMVMKSFENPNDYEIKGYIKETEKNS